jgi:acetyltransferase-like isoleucine patch superfamily enzyme
MKLLMRLVPTSLVEVLARLAGYLVGVSRPHGSFKAERIVRGRYWGLRLSGHDLWIGRHVQLEGARIRLGDHVRLYDGGQYVTGARGWITIGSNTHISRMAVVSGFGGVDIGRGCAISAQVMIYSSTTDTSVAVLGSVEGIKSTVTIGDNVYIGMGARILPGVTVGDDVVVAAGAVVTRDVPAGMLAKGVPATHGVLKNRPESPTASEPGQNDA